MTFIFLFIVFIYSLSKESPISPERVPSHCPTLRMFILLIAVSFRLTWPHCVAICY